jgi:hypothetical protein
MIARAWTQSHHRGRDLARLADPLSEHATNSWLNQVIDAGDISRKLPELGHKVKELVDLFMVILHK